MLAEWNANGTIRRLVHEGVVVNLFPASEVEGGPANLYLRCHGATVAWTPLFGPCSTARVSSDEHSIRARGSWQGIRFDVAFMLAARAPAWFWHVRLENGNATAVAVDLVLVQDLGLAAYAAIRTNEYYTSHYLDHTPLDHPRHGWCVATRQNLPVAGRHPWIVHGSLAQAVSFATDALDVYGIAGRIDAMPSGLAAAALPGRRRQHEHAMVAVQDAMLHLAPGKVATRGFFAWLEPDHARPSSSDDLVVVERALALAEAAPPDAWRTDAPETPVATTLFAPVAVLPCRDLASDELRRFWPGEHRHIERRDGAVWSFFTEARTHVVLRAKEAAVLRPHGQILRTGERLVPDESSLTTTVWMAGVFNALLTQGHVGINRFLSATRSYLGLQRAHGQRVFVEEDGQWWLLDVPSAWESAPDACRWLYAWDGGMLEVRTVARSDPHALELALAVLEGPPRRWRIAHHLGWDGDDGGEANPPRFERDGGRVVIRPRPDSEVGRRFPDGAFCIVVSEPADLAQVGGDELLFCDDGSREQPWVVLETRSTSALRLRITGGLVPALASGAAAAPQDVPFWTAVTGVRELAVEGGNPLAADVARLGEILPWYAHDALVHYLAPRGLEQFSGGGWGTRDVCQGPAELLRALGRWTEWRDLVLRVFANQNPDGDWPQWFMFFERERAIRLADAHGDIVFWPLLTLAEYLRASGDRAVLEADVPFFAARDVNGAERAPLLAHVDRALALIRRRVVPGTHLAAYGNGDWNDSLQPANPEMRERLTSVWTVTLHYQTLRALAAALGEAGDEERAARLRAEAACVRDEFERWLCPDGILAGFAYFHGDGRIEYLLHPRDRATGIRYRLLPMIHAILADLLEPPRAAAHVALIREHLLGADGARLFDTPPRYGGGSVRHFQRAELSAFFGREIGLMYTHAHLRYAEAMAHYGDTDAFFRALCQANPIALEATVPAARPRQANCYYSSSDAVVADRAEAAARYADVRAGRVPLEGGWRVYSSGAGIAVRLVHECLLGLRRGRTTLGIDPVVPSRLDGLEAVVWLEGRPLRVRYQVESRGVGPTAVDLNGVALPLVPLANPYRPPGVTVPLAVLRPHLRSDANRLTIQLG